jgi:hypothetical protein
MTADAFRRLALDFPDVIESSHMGHPDFRANGRIFATLHSNDRFGMVKLSPDEQREFLRLYSGMFEPCAGAWGRQGSTNVRLDVANEATVRGALLLAWQGSAKTPKRRQAIRGSR